MEPEKKPNPAYIGPDHQLPSSKIKGPSGRKRTLIWVGLLLLFALFLFLVVRHHDESKQAQSRRGATGPVVISPTTAKTGDIGIYLESIGTVTPVYTSSITAQVSGQILSVHYKEGQVVQKGQPLIDIDDRSYRAQLTQAQGTLQHDTNVLGQANMDLERYKAAWAGNAIPRQTLEDQEKAVLQDEGTVKTDQGSVQYDEVQVSFCHITAPITGRVGLRLVDPGNVVQAGGTTVLAVITQVQPITVIFTIPEDSLGQVLAQLRKNLKLTVDAYDRTSQTKIATGTLLTTDNQIDTTTGTVKLRAQFDNKNQTLFPNEFVNARLLVATQHGVVLIPTSAIQHNGDASFVYVVQNNAAQMRQIKTGATDGSVTVVQGVNSGEVIADSSFDKLQNGSKVTISNKLLPSGEEETTTP